MIWKDFIVASRLVVHIHIKKELDSKLKKHGSHKFANYYYRFYSKDISFILKNIFYSPNFQLSTTHTGLKIKMHDYNKGAIDNIFIVHLERWCVTPLHFCNLFLSYLQCELNLRTHPWIWKSSSHGIYISNVYEHTSFESSLIKLDSMSNLIKADYLNLSNMLNLKKPIDVSRKHPNQSICK